MPAEKPKKKRGRLSTIIIIAVGACIVMAIFGALLGPSSDDATPTSLAEVEATEPSEAQATATPEPTDTPRPTDTPIPIAPPYTEIRETVQSMTEAQWKAYLRDLKGQRVVDWQGWVVDVDENLFGGYELWVDMDSPDELLSVQDVSFDIPDEIALKINKDQEVVFSGRIKSVVELLGSINITLEDVTFDFP